MEEEEKGLLLSIKNGKEAVIFPGHGRRGYSKSNANSRPKIYHYDGVLQTSISPTILPTRNATAKLPRLHLREFDDDPRKWREFQREFEIAVYIQDLPDYQKLNYLM